jgi:Domain of unknown function (DUF5602)
MRNPMRPHAIVLLGAVVVGAGALAGCATATAADAVSTSYGEPVAVGQGTLRSYVTSRAGVATEIGVALSEGALDGLPTTGVGHHGGGGPIHQYVLDFPATAATPFRFVEVNWNPLGHEPDGAYLNVPHFDFHFYLVDRAARDSIVPTSAEYAARANRLPAPEFVPQFNIQLGPPGSAPADVAVPKMGVHWVDTRSPELQRLFGHPEAYRPFTRTFLHGTWNGRVHFWEPMITRAHLAEKKSATDAAVRDEVIPLPLPARYQAPGRYPTAYRITWDGRAHEYRVALTGLTERR